VFKSRESSAPGIQYRDRRNDQGVAGTGRRADFPGVHGAAFGGTGSIPAPRNLGGMEPGRRVAAGADAPGAVGAQSPADGGRRRASPGGTGSAQPVITTPGQGARRRAEIDAPAGPSRQQNEPRGDNPRRSAIERPDVLPPQPGSTKDNGRAGADRRQADQPAQPRDNPSSGREARPQPRNEAPRSAPQPRNEAPRSAPQPRNEAPRSAPQPRNEAPRSAPAPQSRGSDRPAPSPGLVRRRP